MSNFALSNSKYITIDQFGMETFFYTDSVLFNKVRISETAIAAFEACFAVFLLILFSPVLLGVAIAIKINMKGNIFYKQTRVGKDGAQFSIVKFRTMIENAEATTGPVLSSANDERVTKLGKILRASHLDELPQLLNVLRGEMSFVGPRPERPEFVEVFEVEFSEYKRRREVKPGITGLAQICLPYDATADQKLEYDVFYINNHNSVLLNTVISYYTAMKMLNAFTK